MKSQTPRRPSPPAFRRADTLPEGSRSGISQLAAQSRSLAAPRSSVYRSPGSIGSRMGSPSPRPSRALSRAGTRKSKALDGEAAHARLSAVEFPIPDITEGPLAFEALPNGVVALPHMQTAIESIQFEEDSMGSQVKEARFRRALTRARSFALIARPHIERTLGVY